MIRSFVKMKKSPIWGFFIAPAYLGRRKPESY